MRRLILATLAQAVVVALAGLNLNLRFCDQPVGSFELVHWREIFALLVIVPVSIGIMFHVIWIFEQGRRDAKWPVTLSGVFACLLGISMGAHEPINALFYAAPRLLHVRLAPSLEFWDEIFSHMLFFMAFAGIALSVLWSQVRNPLPAAMSPQITAAFGGIAVLGGAGIFLTLLPGRPYAADGAVLALVLFAAELMRRGKSLRQLPLAILIELSCFLALLGRLAQRFLAAT